MSILLQYIFSNLKKNHKKVDGYIMFPSSHDISPENLEHSILFLGNLLILFIKVILVKRSEIHNKIVEYCKSENTC